MMALPVPTPKELIWTPRSRPSQVERFSSVPCASKMLVFHLKISKCFTKWKTRITISILHTMKTEAREVHCLDWGHESGQTSFASYTDTFQPAHSQDTLPLLFCLPRHLGSLPLPPQHPSSLHSFPSVLSTSACSLLPGCCLISPSSSHDSSIGGDAHTPCRAFKLVLPAAPWLGRQPSLVRATSLGDSSWFKS